MDQVEDRLPVGGDHLQAISPDGTPEESGRRSPEESVLPSEDGRVIQALEEYRAALEAGHKPSRQQFQARYPQVAQLLEDCLDGLEFVHAVAPELSNTGASPPLGKRASSAEESLGTPLGDFRLLREIGRGGMGVVYEAQQLSLGRRVALKVLPFAATLDPKQLQRFKNEAQAAGHLHHTNIVPVFAVGSERGVHYYAMQFIEGQTLAAVIRQLRWHAALDGKSPVRPPEPLSQVASDLVSGRLAPAERPASPSTPLADTVDQSQLPVRAKEPLSSVMAAQAGFTTEPSSRSRAFCRTVAQLGVQVAGALEHAHKLGVVHRDIKPANLLIDAHGNLWVTDFGLAHCQSQAGLTMTGDLLGTLRYMSPEQALAQRITVDHRTDIYSLGVTLYELLTLEPAYKGRDRQELLRQIAFEEPRPPRRLNKAIPADLETIVLKAMAKNPAERYVTAQELADDLQRFLEDRPIVARRATLAQKVKKWARRKPALAALLVVSSVAALLLAGSVELVALSSSLHVALGVAEDEKSKAEQAHKDEATARGEAENQRKRAEDLRNSLQIVLAGKAWQNGELSRTEQLLSLCPPEYHRFWEWQFLKHQCHLDLLTLRGHNGGVTGVAFSPDGRRLASASLDGSVKVWDTVTGREEFTVQGIAGGELFRVAFSPDGRYIAAASVIGPVFIWNASTGKKERELPAGSHGQDAGIAFSADGKWIVSSGQPDPGSTHQNYPLKVWETETGREIRSFPGHSPQNWAVAFCPDGKKVASGTEEGSVTVWDLTTGGASHTFNAHGAPVEALAFSPDGSRLASASGDRLVKVWDLATGRETLVHRHGEGAFGVAFSPDGGRIASCSADRTVMVWSAVSGKVERILRGHGNAVLDVAFSPDGTRLVSGSQDRTIKFWNVSARPETFTFPAHEGSAFGVAFRPGGEELASAGTDGQVKIWDVTTGRGRALEPSHKKDVAGVAFSADGARLASAGADKFINLWDAKSWRWVRRLTGHGEQVRCVTFSPNGESIASGDAGGTVRIWEVATGKEVKSFQAHHHEVRCLAFRPDGKRLASASADRSVKFWDLANDKLPDLVPVHHCWVYSLAFSPEWPQVASGLPPEKLPSRLASVSGDGSVAIWDPETGHLSLTAEGHGGFARGAAFTPDGARLASGSEDGTIQLWEIKSGQEVLTEVLTLWDQDAGFSSLAFSPDGRRLAAAGLDGKIRIWDARPLTEDIPYEREAVGLLEYLFAKPLCKTDVIDYFRNSLTVRPPARDKALALVDQYQEETKPEAYQQASWAVARQRFLNAFQYRFALQEAETAFRLAPDPAKYRITLGVAQFRATKYQEAAQTLKQADKGTPSVLAFLAMAEQRLGQKEHAQATLGRLRQTMQEPRWAKDSEAQGFFHEAEGLVQGASVNTK